MTEQNNNWGAPHQGGGAGQGQPQQGYGGQPQQGHGPPQYEFSPNENQVFSTISMWTMAAGGVQVLIALGSFLSGSWLSGLVTLCVAGLLVYAGMQFKTVVTTQGNDVQFTLDALDKVKTVLSVRIALTIFCLTLALIGAVIVVAGLVALM